MALCTVIMRTPSLSSSRIGASAAYGGLGRDAQLVDEAAERDAAARLVLPRELGDVQHVGQRLFAAVRSAKPTWARVAPSSSWRVSATGT